MPQRNTGSLHELQKSARAGPSCQAHANVLSLPLWIERIELQADRMDIRLRPTQLGAFLDPARPLPSATDDKTRILSVPVRVRRYGREIRMLIAGTGPFATAKPDARLIKLLIRAHRFNATLIGSAGVPFAIPIDREPLTSPRGFLLRRLSDAGPHHGGTGRRRADIRNPSREPPSEPSAKRMICTLQERTTFRGLGRKS